MSVLYPLGLLGLLGLLIPLAIHLLQQGYHKTVLVGSVRWLTASQKPRWRRLRLTQPWLLALRLLLILVATLILAEFIIERANVGGPHGTLILLHPDVTREQLDTLDVPDGEQRWLAPGFPSTALDTPGVEPHGLWELVVEADRKFDPQREIYVVTTDAANNFSFAKPKVGRDIRWQSLTGSTSRKGVPEQKVPAFIDIVVDEDNSEIVQPITRAIRAWQSVGVQTAIRFRDVESSNLSQWVIWMSKTEPPKDYEGVLVTTEAEHSVSNPRWRYRPLRKAILVQPTELSEMLLMSFVGYDQYAPEPGYPVDPNSIRLEQTSSTSDVTKSNQSLSPWLVMIFGLLFLAERTTSLFFARPES